MNIFVTGATGFIGAAFCRLAQQHGHRVAGLIRPGKPPPRESGETMIWLEGRLDQIPQAALEQFQPEVCVHAAWISKPGEYLESPLNDQHLYWSEALVQRLFGLGLKHFVGVGTCLEYAPGQSALREDVSPTAATTAYARCKNAFRQSLFASATRAGVSACWGRVFYPYGPGEHPARLCTSLVHKFRLGEKLILKTPRSTKDYIYVADLAAAMVTTVACGVKGVINWGTGHGTSVRQIADTVAGMMDCPELVEEISPAPPDPLGYVVADAARLRSLGWQPQVDLPTGIKRLLATL